ncbi:MAG: hypothetical protein [Microviridae sp.]|nr:MAG: hypothetical protein [Microviridae sp.]
MSSQSRVLPKRKRGRSLRTSSCPSRGSSRTSRSAQKLLRARKASAWTTRVSRLSTKYFKRKCPACLTLPVSHLAQQAMPSVAAIWPQQRLAHGLMSSSPNSADLPPQLRPGPELTNSNRVRQLAATLLPRARRRGSNARSPTRKEPLTISDDKPLSCQTGFGS